MVETEIERTPELKGNKVIIKSDVKEEMSIDEFKSTYSGRAAELHQIEAQMDALKVELRKYDGFNETKELKKLKEKLSAANMLIKKDELIEQIKKFEKKYLQIKKELEKFNPIVQKLKVSQSD